MKEVSCSLRFPAAPGELKTALTTNSTAKLPICLRNYFSFTKWNLLAGAESSEMEANSSGCRPVFAFL